MKDRSDDTSHCEPQSYISLPNVLRVKKRTTATHRGCCSPDQRHWPTDFVFVVLLTPVTVMHSRAWDRDECSFMFVVAVARFCWPRENTCKTNTCQNKHVSNQTHVKSSTCQIKHRSNQAHVKTNTCQNKHMSKQTHVKSSTCQIKHMSNQAQVKTNTCQNKHMSNQTHVKSNTCQNKHMSKQAHVKTNTCQINNTCQNKHMSNQTHVKSNTC